MVEANAAVASAVIRRGNLRALASSYRSTREDNIEALKLTKIASGLDPDFALSYALGAFSYTQRKAFGWTIDAAQEIAESGSQGERSNSIKTIHRCLQ